MKPFLNILLVLFILSATPSVQAQKWQGVKKLFSTQKAKVSLVSVQKKAKEAVFRAWAKTHSVPYIAQVVIGGEAHHYTSLSPLLPKGNEVSLRVPPFPLPENRKEMYRGMRLGADGKDLLYILKNGLETSKSHYYEDGMSYDGKIYPSGTKAIYVTTDPELAVFYMCKTKHSDSYLPVLLHLKSVVGTKDVAYSIPHDIPASWICRVSALLKVNGRLTWGELKVKDNTFIFTPYPPAKPDRK